MIHLVFGNAVIGVVEGLLLTWMFRSPRWGSIMLLIAANYASAWIGLFILDSLKSVPDVNLQTVKYWFLIFCILAFLVTLLIEFPFYWLALRSSGNAVRRAFVATPLIHGISYALLFVWYWTASGTSMMTKLEVVSADVFKISHPYSIFFISCDGSQISRVDLDKSSPPQLVVEAAAHHRNDRLFARRRNSGFDLYVFLDAGDPEKRAESLVLADFAEKAPVDRLIAEGHSDKPKGSFANFGEVPTIAADSEWTFQTGFWPVEGISAENKKTEMKLSYALDTPFAEWPVRNATQISEDHVVAQIGDDQICLMHLESGKIALIARGKGPIVIERKLPD